MKKGHHDCLDRSSSSSSTPLCVCVSRPPLEREECMISAISMMSSKRRDNTFAFRIDLKEESLIEKKMQHTRTTNCPCMTNHAGSSRDLPNILGGVLVLQFVVAFQYHAAPLCRRRRERECALVNRDENFLTFFPLLLVQLI